MTARVIPNRGGDILRDRCGTALLVEQNDVVRRVKLAEGGIERRDVFCVVFGMVDQSFESQDCGITSLGGRGCGHMSYFR